MIRTSANPTERIACCIAVPSEMRTARPLSSFRLLNQELVKTLSEPSSSSDKGVLSSLALPDALVSADVVCHSGGSVGAKAAAELLDAPGVGTRVSSPSTTLEFKTIPELFASS